MSTVTAGPHVKDADAMPVRTPHVTFPHVLHSEWIKFWTLRSTIWTLGSTVVVMAGISWLGIFFTGRMAGSASGPQDAAPDVAEFLSSPSTLLIGIDMAQLAIAVLGVLVITGEYSTGMIRSTLTAVPRRLPALWAKALALTVVSAATAVVSIAVTWAVTLPTLHAHDATLDLGDSETQRILLGGVLYMVGIALLSFAIGTLVRHSAAALATVLGLLLVVENVFALIPAAFFRNVSPFLPSTAGHRIMTTQESIDAMRESSTATVLGPWQGYGVMMIWVVVLLAAGAVLLRRRDA